MKKSEVKKVKRVVKQASVMTMLQSIATKSGSSKKEPIGDDIDYYQCSACGQKWKKQGWGTKHIDWKLCANQDKNPELVIHKKEKFLKTLVHQHEINNMFTFDPSNASMVTKPPSQTPIITEVPDETSS